MTLQPHFIVVIRSWIAVTRLTVLNLWRDKSYPTNTKAKSSAGPSGHGGLQRLVTSALLCSIFRFPGSTLSTVLF
jgi:hypothetical protein